MREKRWYQAPWVILMLHILAWAAFLIIPRIIRAHNEPPPNIARFANNHFGHMFLITDIMMIFTFYFNAYYLVPKFALSRKPFEYFLLVLVLLVLLISIHWFYDWYFLEIPDDLAGRRTPNPFFLFIPLIFVLGISFSYRVIIDRLNDDRLVQEKENINLKSELSFLRSQVSPHFMFNVMNSAVSLARIKSDALEPLLIKLSHLLRYMLYESDDEKVSLVKEIEYIQSYIDLQYMRFGDTVNIKTNFHGNFEDQSIEPMLLIPFVENAFKHGIGLIVNPSIEVSMSLQGKKLNLVVRNKFYPNEENNPKHSGIGLANVTRRLNLLYGAGYQLNIQPENNWYAINLMLNLR